MTYKFLKRLTFAFSNKPVAMTIQCTFSCHTMCQKCGILFCLGPEKMLKKTCNSQYPYAFNKYVMKLEDVSFVPVRSIKVVQMEGEVLQYNHSQG